MSRVRTLAGGGKHSCNAIEAIAEIVLSKREGTALTRSSPTISALRDHCERRKNPAITFLQPAGSTGAALVQLESVPGLKSVVTL